MTKKTCSVPGCESVHRAKGYCVKHYQKLCKDHLKRCVVEGCDEPHKARGYCQTHYVRFRMGLEIEKPYYKRNMTPPEICKTEGCGKPAKSRDLCAACYKRLMTNGFTKYLERKKPAKPCEVIGCSEWMYAKGLCHRHYSVAKHAKGRGITIETYLEDLKKQKNRCLICGEEERQKNGMTGKVRNLNIDHCHKTGKYRGLLCSSCNTAIGLLKEDPEIFARAMKYLRKHQKANLNSPEVVESE